MSLLIVTGNRIVTKKKRASHIIKHGVECSGGVVLHLAREKVNVVSTDIDRDLLEEETKEDEEGKTDREIQVHLDFVGNLEIEALKLEAEIDVIDGDFSTATEDIPKITEVDQDGRDSDSQIPQDEYFMPNLKDFVKKDAVTQRIMYHEGSEREESDNGAYEEEFFKRTYEEKVNNRTSAEEVYDTTSEEEVYDTQSEVEVYNKTSEEELDNRKYEEEVCTRTSKEDINSKEYQVIKLLTLKQNQNHIFILGHPPPASCPFMCPPPLDPVHLHRPVQSWADP